MLLDIIVSVEAVCLLLIVVGAVIIEIVKRRFHREPYVGLALYEFAYMMISISIMMGLLFGLFYAWLR